MREKDKRPAEGIPQIVVIHRNHGSLHRERYAIKFMGPVMADAVLEQLAKAIQEALRKQGYEIIASGHTAALHGGVGWGFRH